MVKQVGWERVEEEGVYGIFGDEGLGYRAVWRWGFSTKSTFALATKHLARNGGRQLIYHNKTKMWRGQNFRCMHKIGSNHPKRRLRVGGVTGDSDGVVFFSETLFPQSFMYH